MVREAVTHSRPLGVVQWRAEPLGGAVCFRVVLCCVVVTAGDHVKFTFTQSWAVATLSWGLLEYWDAFEQAGELDHMLDCLRWPLNYLLKASPTADLLFYQVRCPS
jgi:hypothetical protein